MTKSFRSAIIAAALLAPSAALAADISELRPASYDWTGAYIGVFAAAMATDGSYDGTCDTGGSPCLVNPTYTNIEHSGIGYGAGFVGGFNFQMDSVVLGIEGDWAFGGEVASNDEPGIDTSLSFDNIGTLRARIGVASGNTLFYGTAGLAAVDTEFTAMMSNKQSDSKWLYGWAAGGGIEHAFGSGIHARLEYLYLGLPDGDYSLYDGSSTFNGTQEFKDTHMIRAAVTYNFSL